MTDEVPEPCAVLKVLKILVTPASYNDKRDQTSDESLLIKTFRTNIDHAQTEIRSLPMLNNLSTLNDAPESNCPYWQFVQCNVKLLLCLMESLDAAAAKFDSQPASSDCQSTAAPPIRPDVLSVQEQQTVSRSLQFIIGLGICPVLAPGIGIPLASRSGYGAVVIGSMAGQSSLDRRGKDSRQLLCTKALLDCAKHASLSELILPRHLGDLLASLCEMCYRPSSDMSEDDLVRWRMRLDEFMDGINQSVVVRELLVLQGAPRPSGEVTGGHRIAPRPCAGVGGDRDAPRPLAGATVGHRTAPPKCPVWMRRACERLLLSRLMKSGGVVAVFRALLQDCEDGSGGSVVVDWRRAGAVARVIVDCPLGDLPVCDYYQHIGAQLTTLLLLRDSAALRGAHLRLVVTVMSLMASRQPQLTHRALVQPLLAPLLSCLETEQVPVRATDVVHVDEEAVASCIELIHKVFVVGCESELSLVTILQSLVHTLFVLQCAVHHGVSFLRSRVEEIVHYLFTHLESSLAMAYLQQFVGETRSEPSFSQSTNQLVCMHQGLKFAAGSNGGVKVVHCSSQDRCESVQSLEYLADNIIHILVSLKRADELVPHFFIHCLKELTRIVSTEADRSISSELLLSGAQPPGGDCGPGGAGGGGVPAALRSNLTLLLVLGAMCEQLGHECFKNSADIIDFVQVMLQHGLKVLECCEGDTGFGALESETLTMALGLLTTLIADPQYSRSLDWERTQVLLPLLQRLAETHSDPELQDSALNLRIALVTHGFVCADRLPSRAPDFNPTPSRLPYSNPSQAGNKNKPVAGTGLLGTKVGVRSDGLRGSDCLVPIDGLSGQDSMSEVSKPQHKLIEELYEPMSVESTISQQLSVPYSSNPSICIEATSDNCKCESNTLPSDILTEATQPDSTLFNAALHELNDPLLPVKGHGLIVLRRLVTQGDAATLDRAEAVLRICRKSLAHCDSYIYLNAVAALAELGARFPALVLPAVAEEYVRLGAAGGKGVKGAAREEGERAVAGEDGKRGAPEVRMKLGEVLVKVTASLGELVPHHRDLLLNCVLTVCKDSDSLVRASAVSNLGQVCQLLRFSLGGVLYEVFSCVDGLLRTDGHVEVRRAAAMFSALLLRGLAKDALKVLGGLLTQFYRLLKHTLAVDKDDVVRLHVQLALEELDTVAREFMFPKLTLTKRIHILDPFDVD